jgi:hypothetical protein
MTEMYPSNDTSPSFLDFGNPDENTPQMIADKVAEKAAEASAAMQRERELAIGRARAKRVAAADAEAYAAAQAAGTLSGYDEDGMPPAYGDEDGDTADADLAGVFGDMLLEQGGGGGGGGGTGTADGTAPTNSFAPMEDSMSGAMWRQYAQSMAKSQQLNDKAEEHRVQAQEYADLAKVQLEKGKRVYAKLNMGTIGGRPTPEDWLEKKRACVFPRVLALGRREWLAQAKQPGAAPTTVRVISVYDAVEPQVRARMLAEAGPGATAYITADDAILALVAREFDQLPQAIALEVTRNKDNYTSVQLGRDALMEIMRYALQHFGNINSAMLDPDVTPERTGETYKEMMESPAEWGVPADMYLMSEFASLSVSGNPADLFAMIGKQIAIVGVVLRCFYGGATLLTGGTPESRLRPMGDDVLSAMQQALRIAATNNKNMSRASVADAAGALLTGCGACGGGSKKK